MRITAATATAPVGAPGAKVRKGKAKTIRAVAAAGAVWRPQSQLIFTSNATSVTAPSNGELGDSKTAGAISTNGSINGYTGTSSALALKAAGTGGSGSCGVASVLPIPTAPSSGSAQVPPLPSSGCAAVENQILRNDALEAVRRSGAEGFPPSREKGVVSCTLPAAEKQRRVSDIARANELSTDNPNTFTPAEVPPWVAGGAPVDASKAADTGGGASAASFEGVMDNSPFVSSSSLAPSDTGCTQRTKASHADQRPSATQRCDNGAFAERPQLLLSLAQDNRGFLNPGYSCDSSDWSSEDSDASSGRAGADGSAGSARRQRTPSAAPSSRAAPSEQRGKACGGAPPPVLTTRLSSGRNRTALAVFPLTAAEEQSARQAYDTYRAQQEKAGYHRSDTSATKLRSQRSASVSPSALSTSTSVGKRELLRLLHGLYHRAQAMMASTTKTAAPTSAPPQRKAMSPTMSVGTADLLHKFPSTKYLLNAAEACFGSRRFRTLMAAVVADSDALVPIVVRNNDGGASAVPTASRSRLSSSSQGLTVEEALSFFRHLKHEMTSDVARHRERRQAEASAKPEAASGDKRRNRPAKAAPLQPLLDLQGSQKTRSTSAPSCQAASQVCRLPSAQAGRRSGRPPPTPIALMAARHVTSASFPPSSTPPSPSPQLSSSPSRPGIPGAMTLVGPRKPTGRRKGPRRKTALPPPSPHPFGSNSCTPDATYMDDFIHTYVQRKAFAEIAEGQGFHDSTTVTLGKLIKVLHWFELALDPSVIEHLCGVQVQPARESPDISIDFSTFVKIINSGLWCQRYSGGSGSSAPGSTSADNNDDPESNACVPVLPPEAPARASPVALPIPGLTAADSASLSTGGGGAPCAKAASSTISVRDIGGSNPSPLVLAPVSAAAHRRLSSLSSMSTSTASSPASGGSMHRSFVDTDDAYPLVAHDSAIAALCRSIRQRLRRELRRSVSSGSNALLRPRDNQGSGNGAGDGAAQKEGSDPQYSPSSRTAPASSCSWRSLSLASSAASSMSRGNVSVAGLVGESESASARDDGEVFSASPHFSKWRSDTKCSTPLSHQRLREQQSPSPHVGHRLPPHSHPYTLTPTPRAPRAQPARRGEGAVASQWFPTAQRWQGHGHRLAAPPPARPATAQRPSLSTAVARRCRRHQESMHFITSLSPYSNSGHGARRSASHCWSRIATLSALSRSRRSSSLHSCDTQSVVNSFQFSESGLSAAFLSRTLPAQTVSRHPKRNRPSSAYTRLTTAPTHDACTAHVSHPPLSPAIRSSPLPYRRRLFQAC
ncbi:streptococcal hemagglutinin-like protein [Leishmania major strain Friedlin]|uniref:Streptococcal hemagglutinin-like protein n=1 Tax=Leishmania major TaxID=5664 RepID=Q4Q1L4_LEIMA|nr:streptococcal hemagglutinin-like protein [Leishmania major strain Friedlin]CAG9583735.1 streptococcal_hemagglutinin-like_protein [Leishmania major strain Friedlin]CAJ09165.1 streptococcal hemagglutinin-like protein [Leishmania major strain Friedlin]|eukprot:XP_001686784.1 streptococcal hemagglutinin-like protein [Leishmania major strain Friedlin]